MHAGYNNINININILNCGDYTHLVIVHERNFVKPQKSTHPHTKYKKKKLVDASETQAAKAV